MTLAQKILTLVILISFIEVGVNVSVADAKRRKTYTTQKININKRFVPVEKHSIDSLPVPAPVSQPLDVPEILYDRPSLPMVNSVIEMPVEVQVLDVQEQEKFNAEIMKSVEELPNFTAVPEYILGDGDQINITVLGEDDVSGQYKVANDGTITMPWLGAINVQGSTLQMVLEQVEVKLKDGYLKNPKVSIEMPVSRPFYILGAVNNPGSYRYSHGMSLSQAVEMSGGFTSNANQQIVDLLSGNAGAQRPVSTSLEKIIKSGDVIFVREQSF